MVRNWFSKLFVARKRVARRKSLFRPQFRFEGLEDRSMMAGMVTWDGGGADNLWSTAENWSTDTVPGASDSVYFDSTSSKNAVTPTAGATVKLLTISADYSGTLELGGDLNATSGFTQVGGTFDANTYKLTTGLTFNVTSGTFYADSGTVEFGPGIVNAYGSNHVAALGVAFNNVTIATGSHHIYFDQALDVNGALDIQGFNTLSGTVYASGNITSSAGGVHGNTSSGTIVIDGNAAQSLTGNTPGGYLPNIEVAKTSNSTLSLVGDLNVQGSWTTTSGKLAAGTSTVTFLKGTNTVDTGTQSLNNVVIDTSIHHFYVKKLDVNGDLTIKSATTMYYATGAGSGALTVAGDLTSNDLTVAGNVDIWMDGNTDATITGGDFPNGGIVIQKGSAQGVTASVTQALDSTLTINATKYLDGSFAVGKDVITYDTGVGTDNVSGGGLVFSGTGNQKLKAMAPNAQVPGVTISKLSGTFTVDSSNIIGVRGDWANNNLGGTVVTAGSTIAFNGTNKSVVDGGQAFNDVIINMGSADSLTATSMTVGGNLAIQSVSSINGTIHAKGNVSTSDTGVSGSGVIVVDGNGPQTLSATVDNAQVPSVTVAKTGGSTLTVDNAYTVGVHGDWTFSSGNVVTTGSTVAFNGYGSRTVDAGGKAFNNVIINMGSGDSLTATSMPVGGDLTITSVSSITGTIPVVGNVTSTDTSVGGNGTILMNGNTDATITGGDFPNGGVIINKGYYKGVTAAVMQALDGPLVIQSAAYLDGTFWVGKDVTTSDTGVGAGSVAGAGLVFKGSSNQTLKADVPNGQVPQVTIDKSGGTLTVDPTNPVSVSGDWTRVNGSVVTTGSTVVFYLYSGTKNVDAGGMKFNNVEINAGYYVTLNAANMTVGGDLTLNSLGSITGTIHAQGNVTSNDVGVGGSGTILFDGTGDQTFAAGVDKGQVPNVEINKPSGKLTVDPTNPVSVSGNWTHQSGDVVTTDSTVVFYVYDGTHFVDDGGEGFFNIVANLGHYATLNFVTPMHYHGTYTWNTLGAIVNTPTYAP